MTGTTGAPDRPPALECRALRKEFPGLVALDDVTLRVGAGELHALVGENGAGKSTLVKIVAGQLAPDGGELLLGGEPVQRFSPHAAHALGVAMVPQHPDLFHQLTALENLFVGDWPRGAGGLVSWQEMRRRAQTVLGEMGVELDLDARVADLTVAARQLLQIARALLVDAKLLILDEPTAPLGQDDTERLFALIRRLHERGVSVIYISHRLAEVFELAQRVTVLRDGKLVATQPIAEVTRESLVGMMVGSEGAESAGRALARQQAPAEAEAAPLLQCEALAVSGSFEDATLAVRPGEILGIAGVAGSGRNELLRALAGVERAAGVLRVDGCEATPHGPAAMRELGVCFVPADRHHEALVLPMTVRENITLGCLREFAAALGLVKRAPEAARAQGLARQLDVRATGVAQVVGTLSGGNQQKVALAAALAMRPRVLLLEEPTQGVDVGARAEIHRMLVDLAAQGLGIILVSSDLPELLGLSQRVLVMHRGRVVGELTGERATQERVLDLALGTGEAGVVARQVQKRRGLMRELGLAWLLIVLVVGVSLKAPSFATVQNLGDILANNAYLAIAAVGMTLVILTAGIDISIGSILAVCATIVGASAAVGWPIPLVLVVGLGAGAALGAINAGLITGARIPPIIATLATLTLFRYVLLHFTGGRWIDLPQAFRDVGLSAPLGLPLGVWVAALAAVAGGCGARWTRLGRAVYAVGSNPVAAANVGIDVRRVQVWVYVLMGMVVGLSAFVYAGRWTTIQTNAGQGFEMVVITAVVVGGTNIFGGSGTVLGTIIGVLLLGVIGSSLTPLKIEPAWEKAFQGALILGAVVVDALRTRRGGGGA